MDSYVNPFLSCESWAHFCLWSDLPLLIFVALLSCCFSKNTQRMQNQRKRLMVSKINPHYSENNCSVQCYINFHPVQWYLIWISFVLSAILFIFYFAKLYIFCFVLFKFDLFDHILFNPIIFFLILSLLCTCFIWVFCYLVTICHFVVFATFPWQAMSELFHCA